MILGRFYLKQTRNRNLLGEYCNYGMNRINTESADLIDNQNSTEDFIGTYRSTWLEEDGPEFLNLNIEYAINGNNRIYNLTWSVANGDIRFYGQGFVVDTILIGDYMDEPMRTYIRNAPNNPLNF